MRPHIEIASVSHRYHPRRPLVLDGIDLRVARGERVALVGRSGCGKSTLLQIIAGLSQPTQGETRIDGAKVAHPSPKWNVMFQSPSLLPWFNVADNVGLGLRYAGAPIEAKKARVAALLERVGLDAHARENVQELSGGQQQRVALARSLTTEPDILLLDEPFSALDAFSRADLQALVSTIASALGVTLIVVTHDVDEALLMADRAVVMAPAPGRIVDDFPINLAPEQRRRDDPAFAELRVKLLNALRAAQAPPKSPDRLRVRMQILPALAACGANLFSFGRGRS